MLTSITKPRNSKEFQNLLLRKDRPQLIAEIGSLVEQDAPIDRVLGSQIMAGTKKLSWLRSLVPDTKFRHFCTTTGLIICIATLQFTPAAILSLVLGLLGIAEGPLRNLSIFPAKYQGPKLPFVLAFDRNSPTYKQIQKIHQRLLNKK